MKKLLLIIFFLPSFVYAQEKQRLSRAYLGIMLHDFKYPGVSLVNSFGINQYLGIGAGADITKHDGELLVPVYGDVRVQYPVDHITPFVALQAGYPLYSNTNNAGYTGPTGLPVKNKTKGRYFLGGGVGISYKVGKVGGFISYVQRAYYYNYAKMNVNGRDITPDNPENAGVITIGLIF